MVLLSRQVLMGVLLIGLMVSACSTASGGALGDLEAEAQDLFDGGRWSEASDAYSDLIGLYEEDERDALAAAYFHRAASSFELGLITEALEDETAAIGLGPSDVDLLATLYLNRSREYSLLGMPEESLADAGAAIDLKPSNTASLARAHLNRGLTFRDLGRSDEAIADFTAALGITTSEPHRGAFLLYRAEEYLALDRPAEAIDDASASIDTLDGLEFDTLEGSGQSRARLLGRAHLVRGSARGLLAFGPNQESADAAAIEADMTTAISYLPNDEANRLASAYLNRGIAHWLMSDQAAAKEDWERARDLSVPGDEIYQQITAILAELEI